jgi:hypothetical protein
MNIRLRGEYAETLGEFVSLVLLYLIVPEENVTLSLPNSIALHRVLFGKAEINCEIKLPARNFREWEEKWIRK